MTIIIMSFNILNVLDNIDNIDLTQNYIYVLELEDNHYYIGRTSNFIQRMNEHFTNNGSIYTKKYKPIKIREVIQEKTCYDERDKTLEYMEIYGWKNVRGYAWCRETLLKKPKIKTKNKKDKIEIKEYFIDDNDNIIRNMYTIENKNIIEIGNCLERTPGSIAYSLEKMGIVNRRQLSNGYFDYIFSDLYDKSKNINKPKINKKDKIEEYVFQDNSKPEKIKLSKDEIKNIKHRLHNILNTYKEVP